MTFGSRVTSASRWTDRIDVGRRRIEHRHPGEQVALVDPGLQREGRLGQLGPVVDPVERPVVGDLDRADRPARRTGPGRRARSGRSRRSRSTAAGRRSGRRSQAASNAYRPLLISSISSSSSVASFDLDDPLDVAVLVADDPAEPAGVGGDHADQGDDSRAAARCSASRASSRSASTSGHVAGQDEELAGRVAGQRREAGQPGRQRVAGAARLCLEGRVGPARDRVPDGLDRRRPDDERAAAGGGLGRVEDVVDHRPAADRMEHLGQARLHPRAEPRGEDDRPRAREPGLGCHALGGA